MADELREAGCVAVSFGYESGCQRILDLINKGVRLEQVPELLAELSRVGIAAQMMGFIGFPGETLAEASQTFEFLLQNRDEVDPRRYWRFPADAGRHCGQAAGRLRHPRSRTIRW